MSKLRDISASPAAPVAPPKPTAPKAPPRPDFKPFNPPRPAADPAPKARRRIREYIESLKYGSISEDFDTGADPGTVDFWSNIRQKQHPFAKHPILAMYGHESAKQAYAHSLNRLKEVFPNLRNASFDQIRHSAPQLAMSVFMQLNQLERPHSNELVELAKEIVNKIWGIPTEMLEGMITRNVDISSSHEEGNEIEDDELDDGEEADVGEVNKRITMNALTQGAAVHNMMSIHHMVSDRIEKIDPRLLQAYDKLTSGSEHMYWLMDIIGIAQMLPSMAVGSAKVEYSEDGQPTVVAKAICFPVLVQELVKGTMELLSHHGLSHMSKGQLKKVYKQSDRLEDEPWLIQVGPHLWRTFLKVVPKGTKLVDVVARLAKKDPKYVHDLLSDLIETVHGGEDPAHIRSAIEEMINDIEEDTGIDI